MSPGHSFYYGLLFSAQHWWQFSYLPWSRKANIAYLQDNWRKAPNMSLLYANILIYSVSNHHIFDEFQASVSLNSLWNFFCCIFPMLFWKINSPTALRRWVLMVPPEKRLINVSWQWTSSNWRPTQPQTTLGAQTQTLTLIEHGEY